MSTLLDQLDAFDALPASVRLRQRSYDRLLPFDGLVVDVGCGAGLAVGELGRLGARAAGVDVEPGMVDVARERWPLGEFHVADACALPFDDATIAGYRADKVLHALDDPAHALVEARRVLVPGGRAVLLGQDWDVIVIDSADPPLTRAVVRARADRVPSPMAARRYRNLLLDNGFVEPTVEVHTAVFTGPTMLPMLAGMVGVAGDAGAVTREQAGKWLEEQTERARDDRLFVAMPMFLVTARRAG